MLRRDEGANAGRRLSDRISGFVSETTVPAGAGLPPKPPAAALDSALSSGNGNGNARRGARSHGSQVGGPPPPPPPDAKEDPRAAAGKRVSYHDMDLVAEVRVASVPVWSDRLMNDREMLSYSTNTVICWAIHGVILLWGVRHFNERCLLHVIVTYEKRNLFVFSRREGEILWPRLRSVFGQV